MLALALALGVTGTAAWRAAAEDPVDPTRTALVVATAEGAVQGGVEGEVEQWLGVRYAAPPGGPAVAATSAGGAVGGRAAGAVVRQPLPAPAPAAPPRPSSGRYSLAVPRRPGLERGGAEVLLQVGSR